MAIRNSNAKEHNERPEGGSGLAGLAKGTSMPRCWLLLGLFVTSLILLGSPASISTAQTERTVDDLTRQLDQDVPGLLRSHDVPGTSLALVEDGEVVWAQGYGMADVAAGKPVRSDTVFQALLSKDIVQERRAQR